MQTRRGIGFLGTKWTSRAGPARLTLDRFARDLRTGMLHSRKFGRQIHYLVTNPTLARVSGPRGFGAELFFGAVADALWQGLMTDRGRCLSPRDRGYNIAMAAAFSGIGGMGDAGGYSLLRWLGANRNVAMFLGGLAGYGLANNPLVDWLKKPVMR